MENVKSLKRGTLLAQEGEAITHLVMIRSGRISLFVERNGKKIEMMTLTNSQILGEGAVFVAGKHPFSAEAQLDSQVIEVPIEVLRAQVNSSPPSAKILVKNLVDQVKFFQNSFRATKLEQEKSPCPQMMIPKVFSILNAVARMTGVITAEKPNEATIFWTTLKVQTSRLFVDSPQRMRSLLDLLSKLKLVELKYEKNEDEIEELFKIVVLNIQVLQDFAEFYQHHLYKGGRSEVIYLDPLAHRVAKALSEVSKVVPPNSKGTVSIEAEKISAELKNRYQMELKDTHIAILEKKGLFIKRQATDTQVNYCFNKEEFVNTVQFWDIIQEIDQWNEKGFVDLSVPLVAPKTVAVGEIVCPSCQASIDESHRFCPHCGFKIAA